MDTVLDHPQRRTRDVGGEQNTDECTAHVVDALQPRRRGDRPNEERTAP